MTRAAANSRTNMPGPERNGTLLGSARRNPGAPRPRLHRRFWPIAVVVLIGSNMALVGYTVHAALRDGAAGVEPDYYKRAVEWDRYRAQEATNERLGWSLSALVLRREPGHTEGVHSPAVSPPDGVVQALLIDRSGAPIDDAKATVEAFRSARAGDRRRGEMTFLGDGRYQFPLGECAPGEWNFRFDVLAGGQRFTCTRVRMVERSRPRSEHESTDAAKPRPPREGAPEVSSLPPQDP